MIGPESTAWATLSRLAEEGAGADVAAAFKADSTRESRYTREAAGLLLDLSHQRLDQKIFDALIALAREVEIPGAFRAMFAGEKINTTEGRAALHAALRQNPGDAVGGADIERLVLEGRKKMLAFAESVRSGGRYDTVINIGIGGSDLGPAMATAALKGFSKGAPKVHFVSNVDAVALHDALEESDPKRTLFIICSKTFTTQETLANAERAKAYLKKNLDDRDVSSHFAAVSVNAAAMDAFGVHPDQRFAMWDWVGGRYSVWSAIGLSLAIAIGTDNFKKFLTGARAMDRHVLSAPLDQNLPVLLALAGIWNINFQKISTLAVLPYTDRLARFPAFLQQLEMESNGKRVLRDGSPVRCATAPVIWGEPGNNAQHSFFQLLHQGGLLAALDVLLVRRSSVGDEEAATLALANGLAQIETFTVGQGGEPHRVHPGSRPMSVLVLESLTPETLGALIALYEHKAYAQSVVWGINAFDQFGVELGKKIGHSTLSAFRAKAGEDQAESLVTIRKTLRRLK
ncbi:MAG: glucose-6-phosphate isomerase [Gammaproteobacteria bacterium]|nr:glucose-6-phosphate isomerase [Gammaproteobacteria bacterium]